MAATVDRCREALSTNDQARLVELAADRSEWVRASVPLNPAASPELMRACLSDRSWRVIAAVADRMASDEQFWSDAEPLSDKVAGWLATCGALSQEWALRLARHEKVSVRESVAASTPWLSAQAQLSRDPARQVRTALAASLFLLPQVREVLVADPSEDVRYVAARPWEGTEDAIVADRFDVTEEDLMAEALRQPGFGAAAAFHFAAAQEHDRTTDAIRQRILSEQQSLPWPAQQGPVLEVPALHQVAIRTDVAGRPSWLVKADDFMELITSTLAELGGLLEDEYELDGDLVITASVPTSLTARQTASAVTAATNVKFHSQPVL
ncbi:MAG: hypothetical protein WBO55_16275 [Rhizobiaceae bacterium]|jgi:hypothetical protein